MQKANLLNCLMAAGAFAIVAVPVQAAVLDTAQGRDRGFPGTKSCSTQTEGQYQFCDRGRPNPMQYRAEEGYASYGYPTARYRYYHEGRYYASPWWVRVPVEVAALPLRVLSAPFGGYGLSVTSTHASWCADRYRTYDPATDMYISYNGPRHCNSPYR